VSRLEVACRHRFDAGFELDCEFVVEQRTTALFGPSGAGKTSLLMMIAGLLRPDEGRIVWDGRVLADTAAGIWLRPEQRRLGVVFQDQRLFPHLSAEANLRFGEQRRGRRGPGGRRGAEARGQEHTGAGRQVAPPFDRIVEVLDLAGLLARRPETLSGGERQRLALGRALLSAPELLLLDEPVAAVDEPRRYTILRYFDRVVHEWNLPMLYVSHHRAEVQRLADWVIAVEGGRVSEQGPPERVLGAGAVVAAGEAVNLMRLIHVEAAADGGWRAVLPGSGGGLAVRLPAGASPPGDPTYVQFAASDVMLARGETAGLSARNRLPGIVIELVPRAGRIFVALQVSGQRLWAEVTADAAEDLGLAPGAELTCLIKSAALRVVE
jgi:molybdate transport system ATP-binding protein